MVTRRTAIGTGLAFASLACTAGCGARVPTGAEPPGSAIDRCPAHRRKHRDAPPHGCVHRGQQADVTRHRSPARCGRTGRIEARPGQEPCHRRHQLRSHPVLSGADRLGSWLPPDGAQSTRAPATQATTPTGKDVAAFLSGAHPSAASPSLLARAYRPSRADGLLHAWVMQKSASPQLRQGRGDV